MNLALQGYSFLKRLCEVTPPVVAERLLYSISFFYWMFDYKHRKYVKRNLDVIKSNIKKEKVPSVNDVYFHFAQFIYEFFSYQKHFSYKKFQPNVELLDALGKPWERSSMILVTHQGNWEMSLQKLLQSGYPVLTVVMRHNNKEIDAFFHSLREHPLLEVSYLEEGIRPCIKAIRENRILALACERDYSHHGVEVNVAGRSVLFPKGPGYLYQKYKLPIFHGVSRRQSLGKFDEQLLKIDEELLLKAKSNLQSITQIIADTLFCEIYHSPEQWITFDDFFQEVA